MASTINGTSTGNGGLISTGDDSGILNIQTNETTAITVDASQNVGIGTSSPATKLDVYAATGNTTMQMRIGNGAQATVKAVNSRDYIALAVDSSAVYVDGGTSSPMAFYAGGSERMRISSAGYVTMPYQPMFSAYRDTANVTGGTGGGTQIIWNKTQVNVSSGYNTGNGYFTAPVAGTYYFSAMGMASSITGNPDVQLIIQNNGAQIAISNPPTGSSNSQGMGFAVSTVITLASGDSIRVNFYSNTGTAGFYASGGVYNNFSGFLIG